MDSTALQSILTQALEDRPEILEAYLFGSHARGEATDHSDIDIAVYVDVDQAKPGAFGYAAALGTDLMAAADTNAIDIVVLNEAPPLLYGRVLQEGVRLSRGTSRQRQHGRHAPFRGTSTFFPN